MGEDDDLQPGQDFAGRYRVERLLGSGDRKTTYLAHDTKLDREVALAVVRRSASLADPEGTRREARVLGHIGSHDNIVSLYDYEIDATTGLQYMVFEYLGGETLAGLVESPGRLPPEEVLRLAQQICRGLAHLHRQGVLHRDVSLSNVWLDNRGTAHLGDFDAAIVVGDGGDRRPLSASTFASPEEREGRPVDQRTDLYSLGGVLRVLAVGQQATEKGIPLRDARPDLPSSFGDLIESLEASSPDDRPASAEEVLQRLETVRHAANLDALIARGESEVLEFKASLMHPYGGPDPHTTPAQIKRELEKSVVKTVAAFLNTSGGDLLIGVRDDRRVLGIEADFAHLHHSPNADGWQRKLKQVLDSAFERDVWSAIHVSLVAREEGTVAIIVCKARPKETWCTHDGREHFYVRTGNATEEYRGRALVNYVRQHWPAS